MTETTITLIWASTIVATVSILSFVLLRCWTAWIELRRQQLLAARQDHAAVETGPALRIELANLRERLRKLEAIATGVDL